MSPTKSDNSIAGTKRSFTEVNPPSKRLDQILEHMGYEKRSKEDIDMVREYIFEIGLRNLVSKIKPGDSYEQMIKRQRMVWDISSKEKKRE